jgi:hypothetical protein
MHILKGETPDFDTYLVVLRSQGERFRLFGVPIWFQPREKEVRFPRAVEADESTGLLVEHVVNENGHPIYTNGIDEFAYDNTATLLMLMPGLRQEIAAAGFRPKVTTTWRRGIEIVTRSKPNAELIRPTN